MPPGAARKDRAVVRLHPLRLLSSDAESLLRMRAAEHARDPEESLAQIRRALERGRLQAVCLYDDAEKPRGFAAWRWHGDDHAQVIVQYTLPIVPPALGETLVDYVFSEVIRAHDVQVIEARMRNSSPGVRAAWARHDAAFFERCRLIRPLGQVPVPILPIPAGYRLDRWDDDLLPQIDALALAAHQDGIEAVAVPESAGAAVAERLRSARAGDAASDRRWHAEASLVALDRGNRVAGYVAVTATPGEAAVLDLSVHPQHRRRGLGRLLLARSMAACRAAGLVAVIVAVTTRNPARRLADQLGFQPVTCGEVAIWWRDGRQLAWREG